MKEPLLFKCVYGSKLFGTNRPGSDTDYKGIYLCSSLDEYMRKQANFDVIEVNNGLEDEAKVEEEYFYIQRFAKLLGDQQTNNISMLFSPRETWVVWSDAWSDLVENRDRLISKNIASYAGYCKGQAVKYTLKGENLRTAEDFLSWIKQLLSVCGNPKYYTLGDEGWEKLREVFAGRQGCEFWWNKTHEELIRIGGKSFAKTTKVESWVEPMASLIKRYGKRAKTAKEDGQDLKAMMHAFRICAEAKELLTTGEIVYPTPRRQFYLDIRDNKFSYDYLQDQLTTDLEELAAVRQASTLPEDGDLEWLKNWAVRWQQHYWRLEPYHRLNLYNETK